jgi:hypothetical protein
MTRPDLTHVIGQRFMNDHDIYHNAIYKAFHPCDIDGVEMSGNYLILGALSISGKSRNFTDFLMQNQNG